jgi:Fe-S cluster assembly protein SufD
MHQSGVFNVTVEEGASYELSLLQTGQDVKVKVYLNGKNASCFLKCVYLSASDSDNKIEFDVVHQSPETKSSQQIKGVVSGDGKTSFYGVIRMPQGSQKCEGGQDHKALLLSDRASVESVPELEIYADDVKCNHGSSIGTLDKMQLFYLMSRGIDEKTARQMLIRAFLTSDMPSDFEDKINEWMIANE